MIRGQPASRTACLSVRSKTDYRLIILFFISVLPVAPYVALFLQSWARSGFSYRHFKDLSFLWQSALGGVFTLEAAFIGAFFIYHTFRLESDRQATERQRHSRARRAAQHSTISGMLSVMEVCGIFLRDLLEAIRQNRLSEPPIPPAHVPDALTERMAHYLEVADDDFVDYASHLLGDLQVHAARMRDLSRSRGYPGYTPPWDQEVLTLLTFTAYIHAGLCVMLKAIRAGQSDIRLPPSEHEIQQSALTMLPSGPDIEGFGESISRSYGKKARAC